MENKPLASANQNWGHAQLLNSDGNPWRPTNSLQPPANTGGGGGASGADPMTDIAGLKKNVGFLNWAVGILFLSGLGAILASYLLLAERIDSRYDRVGDKIDNVSTQIADLRVAVTEVKANGDTQRSSGKGKD